MKKLFATALLLSVCVLFGCIGAKAQTVTKSNEFSAFTGIEASDNFDIVIKEGAPRVEWIVDQMVEGLVQIYQKGSTLVFTFDRKSMTKEQKKYYKGKNAPVMVLKATVYIQNLESLSLKDNVKVDASGANFNATSFALSMDDETLVNSLNLSTNNATIETIGKANVNLNLNAKKVLLKSAKKSVLKATVENCDDLNIKADGSANVTVSGNAGVINVQNSGSAKVAITNGSCPLLGLSSKNSAELDVTAYTLEKADVAMTGGKAFLNVTNILKLDLKSSLVSFMSDPAIEIVKIEKASVTHFNGKK
ncbi:MAG: DUF2807 domain-containing protein [Bacteroidales bacterium]|nr:DUF2807 domain-containing protein [Bacteroidales bacterium]